MHNSRRSRTIRSSIIALIAGAALVSGSAALAEGRQFTFNIPAESTAAALNDLASQANIHLLFPYDAAAQTVAPAVTGTYTLDEALVLILAGANLEIASETPDTITLRLAVGKGRDRADAPTEVVVTGTHIRGANPTSPVHTLTRKDIENSGYSQVGDLMKSLPENFAGGQNPGVFATTNSVSNINYSNASTVNLRGLGSDATLVLVNGHRLSSDSAYQGADISGIPMGAIQRVEIVPDGASALYGADAVAGVVNFVLKKTFSGVDLSAETGASAQGGGAEKTISLLGGHATDKWYALANVEYFKQDPISAAQRDFASGVTPASTLMDQNERKTLFLSAGAKLSDHVDVDFTGQLNDRQSFGITEYYYGRYTVNAHTPAYSGALAVNLKLPGDWQVRLSGVASGSHNNVDTEYLGASFRTHLENSTTYAEVTADGTLFDTPAGSVKLAVGGGHRQEFHTEGNPGASNFIKATRKVDYLYGEALIPLISPSTTRTGLQELEVNISDRAEQYSDFGKSNSPKVGIRYVPFEDLTLRATWGKSFKAPSFLQMYQNYTVYLFDAATLGYAGSPGKFGILTYGGNRNLKPERSTSWTFGGDYHPFGRDGLTLSATYFNIDYEDRVVQPINPLTVALSGNPQFDPFIVPAPSPELQAETVARADVYYNYASTPYDASQVVDLVYDNYQNAAIQTVRGLDLSVRDSFAFRASTLQVFANASWLHLDQTIDTSIPTVELSGTIFNAPSFKARAGLTWLKGAFSATGIVNYIDDETDTGVTPYAQVASWTTVDATLSWHAPRQGGLAEGVRISLAASNLFDKDPPRAVSPNIGYPGIWYDSTNASIVGRYVRLTVAKAW